MAVNRPIADLPKALFQAVKTMPKGTNGIFLKILKCFLAMVRVCIVQFFSWIAYFTFLIYMQSWMSVGKNTHPFLTFRSLVLFRKMFTVV